MGAFAVAVFVGLIALGLVAGLVVLSALALLGLKAVNAAHDGGTWFTNRMAQRRAR